MADSSPAAPDEPEDGRESAGSDGDGGGKAVGAGTDAEADLEALRQRVEEEYDFENFGPKDMARMSAEEWEAAFDPDTWIVGDELLDRVEKDLKSRVASRDVFAVLERVRVDGERALLAYSDEGYATVYGDGTVVGEGTVLRDVEPTVALCSMDGYEVREPPEEVRLPHPEEVPEGTGEFGNLMLQIVAAAQILAGLGLLGAWLVTDLSTIVAPVAAVFFVGIGLFLFTVVANARLSDRFRADEFRARLRATGLEDGERPEFVPQVDQAIPLTGTERDPDRESGT